MAVFGLLFAACDPPQPRAQVKKPFPTADAVATPPPSAGQASESRGASAAEDASFSAEDGPPTPAELVAQLEGDIQRLEAGQRGLDAAWRAVRAAHREVEKDSLRSGDLRAAAGELQRRAREQRELAARVKNASLRLRALAAALPEGENLVEPRSPTAKADSVPSPAPPPATPPTP